VTASSIVASNVTSSSIVAVNGTVGTILLSSTQDVTNSTSGGALVVAGGARVASSLYVKGVNITPSSGDLPEIAFTAANNQSTPAAITGFAFSNTFVRSFNAIVSVSILRSSGGNRFATYILRGVQTDSGWSLNSSFVGDNSNGITFSINSTGQLSYVSTNQTNFTSSTFKFRAQTTSV
jgi:hypothetical protein